MKKCLNCGTEYPDELNFCQNCGQRLVSTNVCPNCGQPIDPNDAFCGHCGHKIEKEYHCESCGAVLPEGAKFCAECGTKVTNPVVSLTTSTSSQKPTEQKPTQQNQQPDTNQNTAPSKARDILKMVFYLVAGGTSLLLLLLMFIGCFGDITLVKTFMTGGGTTTETVGINYFFGKAVEDIQSASEGAMYGEYAGFQTSMLIMEYVCWILALSLITVAIIVTTIKFIKGLTRKQFYFNSKLVIAAIIASLPYLFIFGVKSYTHLDARGSGYTMTMDVGYGWGTMMILVSSIIGVILLALYSVGYAIVEKRLIIRNAILSTIKILFFLFFVFAITQLVSFNYTESGVTVKGYSSPYGYYLTALQSFSFGMIDTMPSYSALCLVGPVFIFAAGVFGAVMFNSMNNSDSKAPVFIFGSVMTVLALIGYAISLSGSIQYVTEYGGGMVPESALQFSGIGIALIIITVHTMVGFGVSHIFKK